MISKDQVLKYCRFETSRSSGPGGQHVNKTESRVVIYFDLHIASLSEDHKERIRSKYANKINQEGELYLSCMASRSQHANKEAVIAQLMQLIENTLHPSKKRIKTKPSQSSKENRLKAKKRLSLKKLWRRASDSSLN